MLRSVLLGVTVVGLVGCSQGSEDVSTETSSSTMKENASAGASGDDGQDGLQGQDRKNGRDGASCSVEPALNGANIRCGTTQTFVSNGLNGANGSNGSNGQNGSPCSVESVLPGGSYPNGGARVTCPGSTAVVVQNGSSASSSTATLTAAQIITAIRNAGRQNSPTGYTIQPPVANKVALGFQYDPAASMGNKNWHCAKINLQDYCGDVDGCRITLLATPNTNVFGNNFDRMASRDIRITSESYGLNHYPLDHTFPFPEQSFGKTYRATNEGDINIRPEVKENFAFAEWDDDAVIGLRNYHSTNCFDTATSSNVLSPHIFSLELHKNWAGRLVIED